MERRSSPSLYGMEWSHFLAMLAPTSKDNDDDDALTNNAGQPAVLVII